MQTLGYRKKYKLEPHGLKEDIASARELYAATNFLSAFDVYEQLVTIYPKAAVPILAEAYDCYQRFPYKDRYHLYQARQFDFGIRPQDRVLDMGSGHIPFPLATHLADISLDDHHYGRAGVPFKRVAGKPVYECDIESTPFEDKQFDFVYCSHVLEHACDPEKACRELMRIAKRGYIETPTKAKDIFLNSAKVSHHNFGVEAVDGALIFTPYTDEEIEGLQCDILMEMHTAPQSLREKAFSALIYLKPGLVNTMFPWEDRFKVRASRMPMRKPSGASNPVTESDDRMDIRVRLNCENEWKEEECNAAPLRFLQIHPFYPQYLKSFYQANPALAGLSFKDQTHAIIEDGFSAVHMFPPYLSAYGYETQLVVANNPFTQNRWLKEQNISLKQDQDLIYETVRRQIDWFKPHIVYTCDPVNFASGFIRSLTWKPDLVMGWRAADIPHYTDWSEFDLILSSLSGLRETALSLGARAVENFFPGFPTRISQSVANRQPTYDLAFTGQWSMAQHVSRNHYLEIIAQAAERKDRSFSCGLYLSGEMDTVTPQVARHCIGPRFGMPMYQALQSGRIVFDARGTLNLIGDPSGKKRDLAGGETANMRTFEATGMGAFLLTEHFKNLKNYFIPGKEIETYRDGKELVEKIDYYLAHPESRMEIARRGQQKCHTAYSMEKRAGAFDRIIRTYLGRKRNAARTKEHSPSIIAPMDPGISDLVAQAKTTINKANENCDCGQSR